MRGAVKRPRHRASAAGSSKRVSGTSAGGSWRVVRGDGAGPSGGGAVTRSILPGHVPPRRADGPGRGPGWGRRHPGGPVTELDPWPEESPPSMARVFDHYLGGTDNTVLDREFAAEVDTVLPRMGELCRAHRAFSAAVVDHFAGAGVDQFLELGAGLPTVDHV